MTKLLKQTSTEIFTSKTYKSQAMTANLKHDLVLETGLFFFFFKLFCRRRRFLILHFSSGETENTTDTLLTFGFPSSAIFISFFQIGHVWSILNRLFHYKYIYMAWPECVCRYHIRYNSWRSTRLRLKKQKQQVYDKRKRSYSMGRSIWKKKKLSVERLA